MKSLVGHVHRVEGLSFSWGGHYLTTVGQDRAAHIWDLTTGELEGLVNFDQALYAVAWSGDGKTLLVAGESGEVLGWSEASQHMTLRYQGHAKAVRAVAWSPQGGLVASAGEDSTVQVWHAATQRLALVFNGHQRAVETLAWSPTGKFLASSGRDHRLLVWNATSGTPALAVKAEQVWYNSLAWHPKGRYLAVACASLEDGELDHAAEVWDVETGALVQRYPILGYGKAVAWLDHHRLLVGLAEGRVERVCFQPLGLQRIEPQVLALPPLSALAAHALSGTLATGHTNGEVILHRLPSVFENSRPSPVVSAHLKPGALAKARLLAQKIS